MPGSSRSNIGTSSKPTRAVVWCLPAAAQAAHYTDRDQVLGRVDRGRRLVERQQIERCGMGMLAVDDVLANELGIEGDVGGAQRIDVPSEAFCGSDDRSPIAEEGDPSVAVGHQVLHPACGSVAVVDEHRVGVEESRRAVDEHDRHAHPSLLDEVAVVVAGRHHDQTIDPPFGESLDQLAFACRVLVDTRRQHGDAASRRHLLDRVMHRGVERVADVGDEHAHRASLSTAASQVAGREVVAVAQSIDCRTHPQTELVRHPGFAVDHPRHGLQARSGEGGHVANRRSRHRVR